MTRKRKFSRRSVLRGAALGAASVAVTPVLSMCQRASAAQTGIPGRFILVINMLGGADGLNMVIPSHLSPYVDRRANINLTNNVGSGGGRPAGEFNHDLDGRFQLHYNLGSLKSMWDDNDLHIVNKVSYPNPNQSHFTSQDIYSFGVRDNANNGDGRGWLGRFADLNCSNPSEPLGVISVGLPRRPDVNSAVTAPLVMRNVETFQVDSDNEFTADHALREKVVRDTLNGEPPPPANPTLTIYDTSKQAYDLIDRVQQETADWVDPGTYPNTALGRYLRTCSQLLHAQGSFGTKILYTGFGGFDTHSNEIARHATLMTQLNDGVQAFRADMVARNKWNDCMIVVISEFGRRVFENGSQGTDHGHGNSFFLMGGRAKGRLDAGSGMTAELIETDIDTEFYVPFEVDFRDIYIELIRDHLGIDPAGMFPDPNFTPDPSSLNIV